ncbi:MAG: HAMP domain-containing histidine kinase [Desulfobacteraceae bacterium]|nr:HAMP domain-containing histidine kinase [Desulfobacteraceae bacterium]
MDQKGAGRKKTIVFTVMIRVMPAAALLLILIWLVTRYLALQTLREEIQDNLMARTHMTAKSVGRKLDGLKAYAKVLSSNDLIINSLIDYTARENYLPTFFSSLQVPGAKNARIVLTDYKGRGVSSNNAGKNDCRNSMIIETVMQGNSVFEIQPDALTVALPVFYSGLPEGVLLIRHDSSDLSQLFNWDSQMMDFAVLLKPGILLFATCTDFSDEIYSTNFLSRKDQPPSDFKTLWLKKKCGIPAYHSLEIVCGIRKHGALSQYSRMEAFLIVAMLLNLVALILGIFLSARLTAKPLDVFVNLIDNARRSRDFQASLPETGTVEIIALASAFNALVKELEQARAELLNKAIEEGRAQLSAMVLHNIGNAITPLSIHIRHINGKDTEEIQTFLEQCHGELKKNEANLTEYVQYDERGKLVFQYMGQLINSLKSVNDRQQKKIARAESSLAYISEIISLQQNYAPGNREIKETINLNRIIETAVQIHKTAIEKRHIFLRMNLEPDMKQIVIDKSRLLQILVNLLKNSYEAIDQSGRSSGARQIVITTFCTESQIGFEIADTGIGIDPLLADTLFELGKSGKGSSGMGLYYCKMFIQENQGEISMTSEGIETGAAVKVLFDLPESDMGEYEREQTHSGH